MDPRHAGTFFEQLRLLSGRLAFKLASATATQRTEVLGLALARLYLDYQGALADQVVVPLDDHLELYRDARRAAQEVGEAVSLQRTDLALWSLDARRRTITCRLVEVKCYSAVRGVSGFEQLQDADRRRSWARSESVLRARFDPAAEHGGPAGPRGPERGAGRAAAVLPRAGGTARRRCATTPPTRPNGCSGTSTAVGTGCGSPGPV